MSYTRYAWARVYTKGDSKLYSFVSTDGLLWVYGLDGVERIEREDVFEFIMSVLERAGIKLSKEDMKKLAKELDVKLRRKPLTWKELVEDMIKKCETSPSRRKKLLRKLKEVEK